MQRLSVYVIVVVVCCVLFSVPAQRLAAKVVSEVTYFVLSGMKNINSHSNYDLFPCVKLPRSCCWVFPFIKQAVHSVRSVILDSRQDVGGWEVPWVLLLVLT